MQPPVVLIDSPLLVDVCTANLSIKMGERRLPQSGHDIMTLLTVIVPHVVPVLKIII